MGDPGSMLLSMLVRGAQVFVEASSTILCGLVVAGVLRAMVGPAGTRKLFGSPGWRGHLRAWAAGMLLPVCSLGVIPIARELRRSGVPSGTVLAFILAAPLLNPISFLYGLTLSEPFVICVYAGASLLLAMIAGKTWEYFLPTPIEDTTAVDAEPLPAPGLKRMFSIALWAGREAIGPVALYVILGIICSGALAGALPMGSLQPYMRHSDPWSVPLMALIAPVEFNSPLPGMMKIGLMFEHGNSVGAAFVLFVFGLGMNVGLFTWVARQFGLKRAIVWVGVVLIVVVALGFAFEPTLFPTGKEEADHTHAFDDFTAPFPPGTSVTVEMARDKIKERIEALETVALGAIGFLILLGLADRWISRRIDVTAWITRRPPAATVSASLLNRPIPGPVLGVLAILGLVIFSVYGAFIYYPPKEEVFDEMARVKVEAIDAAKHQRREDTVRHLEHLDLLTRKLQVGIYLRTLHHDSAKAKIAEDFREEIEELRDAARVDDWDAVSRLLRGRPRVDQMVGLIGGGPTMLNHSLTPELTELAMPPIESHSRALRRAFSD